MAHWQAYLNFSVQAEKKAGKYKTKPVYGTFKKFFDYERALKDAMNNGDTETFGESRFEGIGEALKKGGG